MQSQQSDIVRCVACVYATGKCVDAWLNALYLEKMCREKEAIVNSLRLELNEAVRVAAQGSARSRKTDEASSNGAASLVWMRRGEPVQGPVTPRPRQWIGRHRFPSLDEGDELDSHM